MYRRITTEILGWEVEMDYFHRGAVYVNETAFRTPVFGIEYKQTFVGFHVLPIERAYLKSRWFDFEMPPEIHHWGKTTVVQTRDKRFMRNAHHQIDKIIHTECPVKNSVSVTISVNIVVAVAIS